MQGGQARPEIEFLCIHRLCETSSEFLRSCNVGPRTASNEPCWRRPVLKRFSSTHSLRGSSWPGGQTDGIATREWFTASVADHSTDAKNGCALTVFLKLNSESVRSQRLVL